jgi:ATP-binding protein involved in chromosome partitioning
MPTEQQVLDALRAIRDPETQKDIVALGLVRDVAIEATQVSLTLAFTSQPPSTKATMHSMATRLLGQLPGVGRVQVKMGAAAASGHAHSHAPAHGHVQPQAAGAPAPTNLVPEVRHTVAVSSGKGGVGKSTVAVNLALALRQGGATVGLIDTDVYGPDVPLMLGTKGRPGMFDNKILPVEAHGLKVMSIGLLVNEREAVVWRGPMIHTAIQQFLKDVEWGELDYLIFDMPPGTGDAQLSLSQVLPLSGAIMVTTPQDVSLLDVRKGLAMFRKMNVPILGIVENMAGFECPHCHTVTPIFGEGGGQKLADEFGVPVLGTIPLDPETRAGGDTGAPIVVARPASAQAEAFRRVAKSVVERLSTTPAPRLPTIT